VISDYVSRWLANRTTIAALQTRNGQFPVLECTCSFPTVKTKPREKEMMDTIDARRVEAERKDDLHKRCAGAG
jgi:hypothetical protein